MQELNPLISCCLSLYLIQKKELSTFGMEKIKVLTSFYGTPQKLKFDGKAAVSQPDVDPEEAESECKLFEESFLNSIARDLYKMSIQH